jgi:endonuclease YncB( thermonuclease family)
MNARHGLITASLIFGALLLGLLPDCATADTLSGRVIKLTDGDTLTVLDASFQQHPIRLIGIDAPEREQPFGTVSGNHLGKLVFGRQVSVTYEDQDRYGRTLGKVLINGQDINLVQILAGLAWHYKAYADEQSPKDRAVYAAAEKDAQSRHCGLWTDAHPIPPWDWRSGERSAAANRASVTTAGGCGTRPTCSQLSSCDAVVAYVKHCGSSGLDGDGDGVSRELFCR